MEGTEEGDDEESEVKKGKEKRRLAAILPGTRHDMNERRVDGATRERAEVVACRSRSLCTAACSPFLMPRLKVDGDRAPSG